MKYIYFLLVVMSFQVYGADEPSQLIKHQEGLSRDYYYIDLNRASSQYTNEAIVGGEHENHYLILGFEKEVFIIEIHSPDGMVGHIPEHQDYKILKSSWDEKEQVEKVIVTVVEQHTWIAVIFSAHPFTSYSIEIKKL